VKFDCKVIIIGGSIFFKAILLKDEQSYFKEVSDDGFFKAWYRFNHFPVF